MAFVPTDAATGAPAPRVLHAFAVVEAIHLHYAVLELKAGAEFDVQEGVSGIGTAERGFEYTPTLRLRGSGGLRQCQGGRPKGG